MKLTVDDYHSIFSLLYSNRYFTNHGPLAKELEAKIKRILNAEDVLVFSSPVLAALVLFKFFAHKKSKTKITGATTKYANEALFFLGNEFDINAEEKYSTSNGYTDEPIVLINIHFFADDFLNLNKNADLIKADVIICSFNDLFPDNGSLSGALLIFSEKNHANHIRNMRSSYGVEKSVEVPITCNARFSEYQAALINLLLEN